MSVVGDLLEDTTTDLMTDLFGEFDANAWTRCADVETKQQNSQAIIYTAVAGCVWHPDKPELKTGESRLRTVQSGTLLVPTRLGLTLSDKDRWQDASEIVWRPQTISDDINGFRHLILTREDRQFSGQTKAKGK